jgi:hypothetical protein
VKKIFSSSFFPSRRDHAEEEQANENVTKKLKTLIECEIFGESG